MDLSKVKMVVSDMDGTYSTLPTVNDRFFKIFEILKSKGILFVAVEGNYNSTN
jgi:hydroxymethylpyrimidine pyrophosphatase-like HAD family hydrolase